MPDGYQFGDYEEKPQEPQSPHYTSFARGVLGGFLGDVQQRQYKQANDEREARSNALRWIQSIPMSPHNAPILTKMSLDILASKPGKKHWTDQIFGTGKASTQYIDDLWGKLKGILPPGEAESPEALANRLPDEQTTTYQAPQSPQFGAWANPPLSPISAARQSTTSAQAGAAPPLTDFTAAPATRPRTATMSMFDQQGGARDRTVTQPTVDSTPGAPTLPQRPTLNSNQISFANLPGRWQRDPIPYYDPQGNLVTHSVDVTGMQKDKWETVGPYSTEKQNVATIQANAKLAAARDAIDKKTMPAVLNLAAAQGISPEQFWQMPYELQQPFYEKGGLMNVQQQLGQMASVSAGTEVKKATLPVKAAQTRALDAVTALGGITPSQQLSNYQTNLGASRSYKEKHDDLQSKADAAKRELDDLKNPTTPLGKSLKAAGAPDYMNKIRAAQMTYDEAAGKAKVMRDQADSMFPKLLRGTATGIEQLPSSPQTAGYQGGAIPGAMMSPANPMGAPVSQTRAEVEQNVQKTGQDLIDAIKQFQPSGAPTGKTAAPPSPTPPPGGFKGQPPPITMQLKPRVILGTAKNPATNYRVGQSIRDAGGNALIITKINPSNAQTPYGSVEASAAAPTKR